MKHYLKLVEVLILTSFVTFFSCSDNSQEPPIEETFPDYFPNKNGSEYIFDLEITDSSGNNVIGERTVTYNGTKQINNSSYQILIDEINYSVISITDTAYFKKSEKNVYYNADNSQAMMLIPDSLKNLVVVDEDACLLNFPLDVGKTWQVYKLAINFGVILYNVITVSANVDAIDSVHLDVNNAPFNKEAVKIKFQMIISIDISQPAQYYYAEVWMVENVGLVKLEGDSEAINFMIGNNLFLPGAYIKQTLKQYSIP